MKEQLSVTLKAKVDAFKKQNYARALLGIKAAQQAAKSFVSDTVPVATRLSSSPTVAGIGRCIVRIVRIVCSGIVIVVAVCHARARAVESNFKRIYHSISYIRHSLIIAVSHSAILLAFAARRLQESAQKPWIKRVNKIQRAKKKVALKKKASCSIKKETPETQLAPECA